MPFCIPLEILNRTVLANISCLCGLAYCFAVSEIKEWALNSSSLLSDGRVSWAMLMGMLSLSFPSCPVGKQSRLISSSAWDTGRAAPTVTSLWWKVVCLLFEAIVWLSCTHLCLLRDYSPDFPSPWTCGCWSFHSPLSVAPYLCRFLPHLSSSLLSSPFTSSRPISYPAGCFTSLHLLKSSTVSHSHAIPLDPVSAHSTQHA